MANIKTLKDLTPGTVFDAGPIDVRVLDHMTLSLIHISEPTRRS